MRKPGSIYEARPVTFDPGRRLAFAAVTCYLGKGRWVDVWIEGDELLLMASTNDGTPVQGSLMVKPGSGQRGGDEMRVGITKQ